jgi:thioredoxin-like negative regulator of GroEL
MPTDAQAAVPQRPDLLYFFDRTDGQARRVDGFLAQVLQHRHNHETFRIHRIDVRQRPDLAARFEVEQTPTICVVDNRRVALRAHRPGGPKQLTQLLAPWLQDVRPRRELRRSAISEPGENGGRAERCDLS